MTSDKYRTVVKRQHVRHRERRVFVGVVIIALLVGGGYFFGQRSLSNHNLGVSDSDSDAGVEQELHSLQDELEVQRVQHQLDIATLEGVRKEIASQKEQIAQLEEGLRFYKGLMAPEAIAQGLSLRKLELLATEASNRFIFRLVAQQEALKHALLKGSLSVEILGQENGEEVSYPLAVLSDDIEDNTVALRFRYFQAVEGEIVIPPGFEPRSFSVVARASSPRKAELKAQFPWKVQERFSYVGK